MALRVAKVFGACQVRHVSRVACGSWTSRKFSESEFKPGNTFEDHDMDPVEAKLKSIIREEERWRKVTKFHRMKRLMNKPGPPERRLTWDAIEQIRFLKQESPEEWTIQSLAEGFSVNPDVISRILGSKFTPPAARKLKQDTKVHSTEQLSLDPGTGEANRPASALLHPVNTGLLSAPSNRSLVVREGETRLSRPGNTSTSTAPSQISTDLKRTPALHQQLDTSQDAAGPDVKDDVHMMDQWDGVVLSEEEIEQIATREEKPSLVEQKGSEFFDSKGNFLYRI